jgi:RNA polymerase sigma-70 factor (ECF subfamily)
VFGPRFAEVLEAARAGDDASFAALWRDLNPALVRYLRVIAPHDADDLASETWATVSAALDRFTGDETAFRGWVFVTARRRAVDHFRRERRRPAMPVDPEQLREALVAVRTPSDDVLDALGTEEALAIVATLPPDQAEVVALRTIAGLDVDQVAEVIGKRPGAVRVLAHRGLKNLAKKLDTKPLDKPTDPPVPDRAPVREPGARRVRAAS